MKFLCRFIHNWTCFGDLEIFLTFFLTIFDHWVEEVNSFSSLILTAGPGNPCGPAGPLAPRAPASPRAPWAPAGPGDPWSPCHMDRSTKQKLTLNSPPFSILSN